MLSYETGVAMNTIHTMLYKFLHRLDALQNAYGSNASCNISDISMCILRNKMIIYLIYNNSYFKDTTLITMELVNEVTKRD